MGPRPYTRARDVTHKWSGQVLDTIDYAGFIGVNPGNEHIYVHTGDSGQGMTHGVAGAMINAALILGERRRGSKSTTRRARRRPPSAISLKRT